MSLRPELKELEAKNARLKKMYAEERLRADKTINDCWSMDFMHDSVENGRRYRLFNVIDDFNREGLGIEINFSLLAERVIIRVLDQIVEWRGRPKSIRCDNGPEYISKLLSKWSKKQKIELLFIQPGQPQQNAYIERYNRTVRYDWLSQHLFYNIQEYNKRYKILPLNGFGHIITKDQILL